MNHLREMRGLNYGDYAYVENFIQDGWSTFPLPNIARRQQHFELWLRPVPPHNSLFALRAALYETDKLIRDGIPQAGFETTRTFLANYSNLWAQDASRRLGFAIDAVVTGKDVVKELQARLPKMKKADVDRAVRKYISLQGLTIAIVADKAQVVADTLMSGGPTGITYDTAGTPARCRRRGRPDQALPAADRKSRRPRRARRPDVREVADGGLERDRRNTAQNRTPRQRRSATDAPLLPAKVWYRNAVLSRTAASEFTARFGRPPRWVVAAPGRVNIIGEHTDYSGGLVLPMAIDRHTVIAAAPAAPDAGLRLRLHSAAIDESVDIPLAATPVPGEPRWANYARGVVAGFGARGLVPPALDALVISDVPLGGGLSSSASFEVATATLLEAALGTSAGADARRRASAAQAEHDYARRPVRDHGPADLGAGRRGGRAAHRLPDANRRGWCRSPIRRCRC